jgi:protein associated with RNAse G/E
MNAMGALMKAKIRGIYSTALTKMLLDNGFEIVQPSLTIKNRFGLSDNSAPPDIKIKDRYDLQGVRVLGTSDAVNAFQPILHSAFEDVLTRKWHVNIDGIYKGKPIESDEGTVYVDIGGDVIGSLPKPEFVIAEDKPLLVQVERKRIGAKQPILTTMLKIVGNYAILAQNSRVGVSLKICDLNKRAELYALGKMLAPEGWGIIWRESSVNQSREMLENEVTELAEKVKILNEKATRAEAPALLIEGLGFMDVEFPYFSKKSLDKLRASVAQTLDGHHFYKCCGGEVSAALEMAEKLLEKGQSRIEVEKSFREQLLYKFPEEGSLVDVEHVKLSGLVFHLGQATIESLDDEQIKYSRIIQSDGFYDGLGVKKEAGDKAVSQTKIGEWSITTKYFSNNGEWKGTYINLNTPIEVYQKAIRYVDLEVDVCIHPEGTNKILDVEKLEKALEKGCISRKLFGMIKEKVKEIAEVNVI